MTPDTARTDPDPGPSPRLPRSLRAAAALLGALLTAAACAAPDPAPGSGARPASGAAETESDPDEKGEITVAFGGDVHFEGMLRERLDDDAEKAMGPIGATLGAADIAMVNLETAVTEGGTRAPGKEFAFRAPPAAFDALKGAGVDVASVANNHGMDYGADGLGDTLDHAEEAGFPIVGAGRNEADAYAPHVVEANGATAAFIGATDVIDEHLIADWTAGPDRPGLASAKGDRLPRLLDAVRDAAEQADNVIVHLHWGLEGERCPLPHAPDLARQLIDAGASAVVGGHAHVVSPGGYMGDAYVHYGMGNFVFYNFSGPTAETGVLRLTLKGGEVVDDEWLPGTIDGGVPVLDKGAKADRATEEWAGLRGTCDSGLAAEPGAPEDGG